MKKIFAFTLLCFSLSSPPAVFGQITEEEILALIAANDLVLARERVQQARRDAPSSAMSAYYSALLEDDADAAASAFIDFIKRFEDSAYADRALYRLGQYYFARGTYNRSRQYFVELVNKHANSPLAASARYQAAKALLLSNDLYGAKTELENVARQYPGTWMAKFAQEDLQQDALKSLPANAAPPPRLEEKVVTAKTETPAAPRKEEPRVEQKTPASNKEQPKATTQPAAPPRKEERKSEPPVASKKAETKPKVKVTDRKSVV